MTKQVSKDPLPGGSTLPPEPLTGCTLGSHGQWEYFVVTYKFSLAYSTPPGSNNTAWCSMEMRLLGHGMEDAIARTKIALKSWLGDRYRYVDPTLFAVRRDKEQQS